jgi:predicted esterase
VPQVRAAAAEGRRARPLPTAAAAAAAAAWRAMLKPSPARTLLGLLTSSSRFTPNIFFSSNQSASRKTLMAPPPPAPALPPPLSAAARAGRLTARPLPPGALPALPPLPAGTRGLALPGYAASDRGAMVHVPPACAAPGAALCALVVALHGAGGHAAATLDLFGGVSPLEQRGALLLVPESRSPSSWDLIASGGGAFGPDVAYLDACLAALFSRFRVDPGRVVLAGFSDGASYALSLGLANGALFSHLLAFSPGFMRPPSVDADALPRVWVQHGVRDGVLPIGRCSRPLVPRLRALGAEVRYEEFDGPHAVPPGLAVAALDWALARPRPPPGGAAAAAPAGPEL